MEQLMSKTFSGYTYADADLNASHEYLLPCLRKILEGEARPGRLFEVGCGNGSIANVLSGMGFDVTGVDPSEDGIAHAHKQFPGLKLHNGSAYDDLAGKYGSFPVVVSLEVVEHVYHPRQYAQTVYDLLEPGGIAVISAPYHGYWKNLALAVTDKMDAHFTALWDGGHIKFWSKETLTKLLNEVGLDVFRFERVGRIPVLAKSMVVAARKRVT